MRIGQSFVKTGENSKATGETEQKAEDQLTKEWRCLASSLSPRREKSRMTWIVSELSVREVMVATKAFIAAERAKRQEI